MYVSITGPKNSKSVYILRTYTKDDGSTSSTVHRKLGKLNDLLPLFDNNKDKLMEWAKSEAKKDTDEYNEKTKKHKIEMPQGKPKMYEDRLYNAGYLFLQQLCYELKLPYICNKIKKKYKFRYDLNAILTDLIYARILSPSSKNSSYNFCKTLLEPPKYEIHDVYRALSVLADENYMIQEEVYKNSNFIHGRNKKILFYDCTNYYFEIEEENGIKKYGKSKEHRPNPIVTMGMFMDADGIPIAFDVFPGNQNEQTTLKPIEKRVIKDFECSEFIFCSDSGLASKSNKEFNTFNNRAYIITQSLKKLKKEDRENALKPENFRLPGNNKYINLNDLDETDPSVYNSIYYKEIPLDSSIPNESLIVTYSLKYKYYQRQIREKQIGRAEKMINTSGKKPRVNNPNDPARFIKKTPITNDGEIAEKEILSLDLEKIYEESKFDGFYAVVTNLEGDISEIIKINKNRWEIEENFRIMKTEFKSRPVYVQREDRIKAHFLTCYLSLLIYRLLEKRLDNEYTCDEIISTLRHMNLAKTGEEGGYSMAYKRTELTNSLHMQSGFETDDFYMSKAKVRNIIKKSKERKI